MRYLGVVILIALSSCADNTITSPTASPSPISSPSPTPVPTDYRVIAIVTQGGANNSVTDVNAGETFKTSITGVQCSQDSVRITCPAFGGYLWRLKTLGLGLCSDAGSVDSSVDSWVCAEPTYPAAAEFEGCVLDFSESILGCASVKIRVH